MKLTSQQLVDWFNPRDNKDYLKFLKRIKGMCEIQSVKMRIKHGLWEVISEEGQKGFFTIHALYQRQDVAEVKMYEERLKLLGHDPYEVREAFYRNI